MTTISNRYLLVPRSKNRQEEKTYEPKFFKELVEGLPAGNVGQMARRIHRLLSTMNALEIPAGSRMENLEVLLAPMMYVLKALSDNTSRGLPPLDKRQQLIVELHDTLCILIIQAYKVVLDQYHGESLAGQLWHKQQRTLALHRVLFFLGQSLLHAYRLYQSPPKFLWQEIHGIHQYAVDQHLADRKVANEDPELVAESTVGDLYRQTLLLSLAGPYRLMQGEVMHVYMALKRWAEECRLVDLGKSSPEDGAFLVDIRADEPPRLRGAARDQEIKRGWVLDTSNLAILLAQELEQEEVKLGLMRPKDALDSVSTDLLARLMLTWGIGVERGSQRNESPGEATLVCGMNDLYVALGGEEIIGNRRSDFSGKEKDKESDANKNKKNKGGLPETDIAADEYLVNLDGTVSSLEMLDKENIEEIEITSAAHPNGMQGPFSPVLHTCALYDESDNGCHLAWSGGQGQSIKVGELVGIQYNGQNESGVMRLGVVRWMRAGTREVLEFGVELFMGDVSPVVFCYQRSGNVVVENCPGFLLDRPGEDATLLTPPFYFEPDDSAWLIEYGEGRSIYLNRVIEATVSFIQFHFSRALPADSGVDESGEAEDQFAQLWDSI